MPTRLYLYDRCSTVLGRPTGSAATDLDGDHVGPEKMACRSMGPVKPSPQAQHQRPWWEPYSEQDHRCFVGAFISPALAAQTLRAGEHLTVAGAVRGWMSPGQYGGLHLRAFVYLWRRYVGWAATLSAADRTSRSGVSSALGDWGFAETWCVIACPAPAGEIAVQAGDRIVVELWADFRPSEVGGHTGPATYFEYWNGGDDSKNDGEAVASAASYVEYSGVLDFQEVGMDSGNILIGARDIEVDGDNIGALEGGVEYRYAAQVVEHEVDQRLGIVGADKIKERVTVTCRTKEATLENLRIAMAQPSYALSVEGSTQTLNFGGQRAMPTHAVSIAGKGPGTGRTRTLYLRRAVVIESGAHAYTKDGATVYAVTFLCLEDATQADGFRYGYFRDEDGVFAFA